MLRVFSAIFVVMLLLTGGTVVAAQDDDSTTVQIAENDDLGQFFADAEGMTLYLFTNDTEADVSACEGGCLENWPAFTAEEPLTLPEGVDGELALFDRGDGTMQVSYNGIPLYYFAGDAAAGDTNGEGVGDVWFVVHPGAEMGGMMMDEATPMASPMAMADTTVAVATSEELGDYLTDANGMTLYLFTVDEEPGVSACYDDCVTAWPLFQAEEPLTLPDGVDGELTIIERDDGETMVAYNGIPLYYWQADQAPGDTTGHEVGGVWFVVAPGTQHGETEPIEDEG